MSNQAPGVPGPTGNDTDEVFEAELKRGSDVLVPVSWHGQKTDPIDGYDTDRLCYITTNIDYSTIIDLYSNNIDPTGAGPQNK